MQVNEKIELNINEYLETLMAINSECEKLKGNVPPIVFLTIKDVAEILGWSIRTVQELFRRDDFPSTDFGIKCIERGAFINYFSVPRRKEN